VKVHSLHRAAPRLDGVLDEVALEDQLVHDRVAREKIADRAAPRQHHGAVDARGVEELEDGMQAPSRPAVAHRVVDEEDAKPPLRRSPLRVAFGEGVRLPPAPYDRCIRAHVHASHTRS
jgi:hypothetical protein